MIFSLYLLACILFQLAIITDEGYIIINTAFTLIKYFCHWCHIKTNNGRYLYHISVKMCIFKFRHCWFYHYPLLIFLVCEYSVHSPSHGKHRPRNDCESKVKQKVLSWNAIQNDMSRTLYINKMIQNDCLVTFQDIVYNNTIIIIGVLLLVIDLSFSWTFDWWCSFKANNKLNMAHRYTRHKASIHMYVLTMLKQDHTV